MKIKYFAHLFALSLMIAVPSFADDTAGAKSAASTPSPKATCAQLAEAAKKDDFPAIQALTTDWAPPGGHPGEMAAPNPSKSGPSQKSPAAIHAMHEHHLSQLKDLTCGSEHVAGDHAVVEAESLGQKRLIPFIQVNGQWKFDARTYMSFYRQAGKVVPPGNSHG